MKLPLFLMAMLLMLFSQQSLGYQRCDDKLLDQVENENMHFQDWASLYRSYTKFKTCDQGGGVSEGYSEAVVRLLADHWVNFYQFGALSTKDKAFKRWVLNHIDATTSGDDLKAVTRHASTECPKGSDRLCKEIRIQVDDAIREANKYEKK